MVVDEASEWGFLDDRSLLLVRIDIPADAIISREVLTLGFNKNESNFLIIVILDKLVRVGFWRSICTIYTFQILLSSINLDMSLIYVVQYF